MIGFPEGATINKDIFNSNIFCEPAGAGKLSLLLE
jgi:hypothetical protein